MQHNFTVKNLFRKFLGNERKISRLFAVRGKNLILNCLIHYLNLFGQEVDHFATDSFSPFKGSSMELLVCFRFFIANLMKGVRPKEKNKICRR